MRRLTLIALAVAASLGGCQAVLTSFFVPTQVQALETFAISVRGTGTTFDSLDCGCVLQVPNGFVVGATTFSSTETIVSGPNRDAPGTLSSCVAEPGHYLVAFTGRTASSGSNPTGTLTISLTAPEIAPSQVTFKVAMIAQTSGSAWQVCDPVTTGALDFAAVGGTYARTVQFDANRVETFGTACAGTGFGAPQLQSTGGLPARGNGLFGLTIANAPPDGLAAIWIGVDRTTLGGFTLPLDLLPFGAPGCRLYVNPLTTYVVQFDVTGGGGLSLPIPNDPALQGATFFAQGGLFASGANAAGMLFSGGLSIRIV
ncbi:MAG: hypothetical protein AB7O97_23010 [Planctomycetota bacterium]